MRLLPIKPKIFRKFPKVRTFFAVGRLEPTLKRLRKKFVVASMKQAHGQQSADVAKRQSLVYPVDALYTTQTGVFLAVRSADCLPVMFFCPKIGVAGVVHAGWRGTRKKILQKTLRTVFRRFHASFRDFYFFFGPAARPCCYKISPGDQRLKLFAKQYFVHRNGKMFLDFVSANRQQLKSLGVKKFQVEDCGICTIHNRNYPSHRREGAKRNASLVSLIALK